MRTTIRLFATALIAALLLAPARAGDEELPLLRRMEHADTVVSDSALEEFEALSEEARVTLLRKKLRSEDQRERFLAAATVSEWALDLEELRLQALALAGNIAWVLDPGAALPDWASYQRFPIGAPELPLAWASVARSKDFDASGENITYLHRAVTADQILDLVPLLEADSPKVFKGLLEQANWLANETDEHRAHLARAFLYGIRRIVWERSMQALEKSEPEPARPDLGPVPELSGSPGLAPELKSLLAHSFGVHEDQFRSEEFGTWPPSLWSRRWLRDSTPVAADIPFLLSLAREEDDFILPWAVRKLAEAAGDDADRVLAELADDEDQDAARVVAAALLAERGVRKRYDEWAAQGEMPDVWRWSVEPEVARAEFIEDEYLSPVDGLSPQERRDLEATTGIRIRDEDLEWTVDALCGGAGTVVDMVRFLTECYPEGVAAGPRVAAVVERLKDAMIEDAQFESEDDSAEVWPMLGLLEAADREALLGLLRHWNQPVAILSISGHRMAPAGAPAARVAGSGLLRLGETLALNWPKEGEHADNGCEPEDRWRVWRNATHQDSLTARVLMAHLARSAEPTERTEFLEVLAVASGVAPDAMDAFAYVDDEAIEAVLEALRDERPSAALLAIASTDEGAIPYLGLAGDERALEWLRERRDARHEHAYWQCTLGLALSGDAAALVEIEGLLRENRTWVLDELVNTHPELLARLPTVVELSVDRYATNCCGAYQSHQILAARYPTLPVEFDGPGGNGARSAAIRAWLDEHAGKMRKSKILDAWLPGR